MSDEPRGYFWLDNQAVELDPSFPPTYTSAAESKRIYDALSEGAKQVTMPFQKTFWSEGFGMFTDRFGTPWMVNTEAKGA